MYKTPAILQRCEVIHICCINNNVGLIICISYSVTVYIYMNIFYFYFIFECCSLL